MNIHKALILLLSFVPMGVAAQKIETESTLIDCGQIIFSQPLTSEFLMKNGGRRPLMIRDVKTDCGCTVVDYPRRAIASGETFSVKAVYDARTMGHFTKQIGVYSNASDDPLVLTLRGVVVDEKVDFSGQYPYTLGEVKTDLNDVEFDDVNRGDRPYQRIHLFNSSSETIEPVVMHLPSYLSAQVSPSRIAPGHAGVATLMLDPRKIRSNGLTQTSVYLGAYPGDKVSQKKEITVSAVVLPNFDNMTETQKEKAPVLEISTETLDLGAFDGKSKKKGEITIANTGHSTLEISSLQMFTTGIEVSLNKTRIAPGETAKMKVTAIARQLKAARSKPRILMITNDPDHAKVVIKILVK